MDNTEIYISTHTGEELDNAIDNVANKADKATTLAGYGINDAYTKATIDMLLLNKISAELGEE